jgi:hypothetical protein
MVHKELLLSSHQPTTGNYPEPGEFIHIFKPLFLKTHSIFQMIRVLKYSPAWSYNKWLKTDQHRNQHITESRKYPG